MNVDLADFYGSIPLHLVAGLFESLGAGRQPALTLARLSTIDGTLIQGGRASPSIANLVAKPIDEHFLAGIPKGCRYTRYVDDITVSGASVPSEAEARRLIEQAGFALRVGSYSVRSNGAGPYVTGLQVGGGLPRAPRDLRRRVERFLHFAEKFGKASAAARTFKTGERALSGDAALKYVRGVANWIAPIDRDLSVNWMLRADRLR